MRVFEFTTLHRHCLLLTLIVVDVQILHFPGKHVLNVIISFTPLGTPSIFAIEFFTKGVWNPEDFSCAMILCVVLFREDFWFGGGVDEGLFVITVFVVVV